MIKNMNIKELLLNGNVLSAELDNDKYDKRHFIVIGAYVLFKNQSVSIKEFRKDHSIIFADIRYYVKTYVISNDYIKNGYDIHREDFENFKYKNDIIGFENLKNEIRLMVGEININEFVPIWKTDAPE